MTTNADGTEKRVNLHEEVEKRSINFSANADHTGHAQLIAKLVAANAAATGTGRSADQTAKPAPPATNSSHTDGSHKST